MLSRSFRALPGRSSLLLGAGFALTLAGHVYAGGLTRTTFSSSATGFNSPSSSASTSQTANAATAAAAQAAQAAATANKAQQALQRSMTLFQDLQQSQAAARLAAQNNAANNLGSASQPINGLGVGGLNPLGGVPAATSSPAIQVVDLGAAGKNQLALGNGGSVTLPAGTTGADAISISGMGSVTTTSGTVTANAGQVTTTSGGTLAATNGGSISLTAGSGTLSSTTSATIVSALPGTITLPANAGTLALAANQPVTVPAGSSISFTGSGTDTVTVSGAGTLTLKGAGTLALASPAAGVGGTITANSGTTSFTNSAVTSLASGSTVNLSGSGTISFDGSGNDVLPVIVQPTSAQTLPAFTTTGTLLSTTGYNLPSTWSGIGALSQSTDTSGATTVTISQVQSQALLYWQTFNVGKNTTLDFDQSAGGANVGDWVAINRILDPSLAPTRILGAIQASGQVYVIDQNNVIFSGSSQVNAGALVVSTLPINTSLVTSGLLNNPDGQYLFTTLPVKSPVDNSTLYDPNADYYDSNHDSNTLQHATSGSITVQPGATLTSPGSADGVGGKIALIAPSVENEGTISAPDGQVILAAGQQVGLAAHLNLDPTLRGLDVAVGQGSGTVINGATGLIEAPEGDVTMAGSTVNQLGDIDGGTSVSLNGRIDLLAMNNAALTFNPNQNSYTFSGGTGGTVTLGPNSVTDILPEYASTDTAVGTSLALPSIIYVEGENFNMESGAQMIAPNATVTFSLGIINTPIAQTSGELANGTEPEAENFSGNIAYLANPGQFTLDSSADIDVSGSSNVQASVTENIVQAQLTAAILENSPLQQSGPLHGATVSVDVSQTGTNADGSTWYGSPIGDLSGYANLVERTVGELTVAGGSVAINTNGSVNLNPTSMVNVSGGSIDYAGATVATTKLIASNGTIIDISQASPNQSYLGVYTGDNVSSPKWGVSQNYSNSLDASTYYDAGYISGGNAGTLSISASSASFGGSLLGNTTIGSRQQSAPPTAGTFDFTLQSSVAGLNPPATDIIIQPGSDAQNAANTIYFSSDLFGADGFGNATLATPSGTLTVSSDAVISVVAGGSISLTGANVAIDGQIYAPSGSVSVTALPQDYIDLKNGNPTPYDSTIGNVEVASGAVIDTSGLTFDETSNIAPGSLPFSVNGGNVSISGAVTKLDAGSVVAASGGAARNVGKKVYDGKGGTITLKGSYNGSEGHADGQLVLAGNLSAYGIGEGGSLSLTAPAVQIGGAPQSFPTGAQEIFLTPGFFNEGGFSSFSMNGSAGVQILSSISPILTEEIVSSTGTSFGTELISSALLPQYPAAPVNLSFTAPGSSPQFFLADLVLGSGADITAAPTSSISFNGQLIDILGDMTAPGGKITISGASTKGLGGQAGNFSPPDVSVYLGPQAMLSTAGEEITTPTLLGPQTYETGEVLNGGTITITGNIVGAAGSSLNADGTAGTLDVPITSTQLSVPSTLASRTPYVPEVVASNGGSISLNGIEELYFDGTVSAKAGNQTALGGTLTVGSGLAATYSAPPNAGYSELFITQNGTFTTGTVTLGHPLTGVSQTGGGYFTVNQFTTGGFGSLILDGNVEFEGNSAINITASQEVEIVPDSQNGTIFADPTTAPDISITAPYIAIGATTLNLQNASNQTVSVSNDAPSYVSFTTTASKTEPASPVPGLASPTYGSSTLTLNSSDLIDVGFLSLQNIGETNFSVANGDIRGGGLLYAAGTINLLAGQIYTPTAATFTVAAFDAGVSHPGTVNILPDPGVSRPLPLSAGGTINIYATDIVQDGNLEAPFGTINLGALDDPTTGLTPVLAGINFSYNQASQTFLAIPVYTQHAPVTQSLTLGADSITSVSGVSSTGQTLDLPYGTILNGGEWIAPNGANITAGGLPVKAVNLEGVNVSDLPGSLVDLAGGGDLFAYQFNPGVGGTNDILSIDEYSDGSIVTTSTGIAIPSTSFAILPDYGFNYAPIDLTIDGSAALPYANPSLTSQVGDQIYLAGGSGLAAGTYTLLPARYALLPGAYLVTPESVVPGQPTLNPNGSLEVGGYTYNSLDANRQVVPNVTSFEVDSRAVVNSRAEYDISSANTFLAASARASDQPVPRLPMDSGELIFSATGDLELQGNLTGQSDEGGLGSTVDIGSPDDIYIVSSSSSTPDLTPADQASGHYLTLDANQLDNFGSSLLIGGVRTLNSGVVTVDPTTSAIYVQNTTTPLTGDEIILVSKGSLTVDSGAVIEQTGGNSTDQNLTFGSASTPGSGDGTLIRVTGDPNAQTSRLGVNTSDTSAQLTIDSGASISGIAVTLDSSSGALIDPGANLDKNFAGQSLILQSGAISLQIDPTVSIASAPGLAISSTTLQTLQSSVERLSLSSYSSINFYGAGTLGGLDSLGQPVVHELSLEGAGMFGYDANGGTLTINAQNVSIDNSGNETLPGTVPSLPTGAQSNALVINASVINLGANTFAIDGYSTTTLAANDDIEVSGTGGLDAQGQLDLVTPVVTAATAANYTFTAAGGSINLSQPTHPGAATSTSGLGATLSFTGSSVNLASTVSAPSGTINVTANTGNVELQSGADLKAGGKAVTFGNTVSNSNGGMINLVSANGDVVLDTGSLVDVSTPSGGGNAGTLAVSADNGTLSIASGTLIGTGGAGGVFTASLGEAPTLSGLTTPLTNGGFESLSFDVLTGSVTIDGAVGSALGQDGLTSFSLTTEQGGITVDNTINASGITGGTIDLYANQDVTLTSNADLTVEAQQFNDADKGGVVDIETRGAGTQGINVETGSTINLAVDNLPVLLPASAANQAGNSITLAQAGAIVLPNGTPGNDQLTVSSSGTITAPGGATTTFTANQVLSGLAAGSTISLNSPGSVTFVGGGTGGTVPVWLSSGASFTSSGATNATGTAALTAVAAGDQSGVLHLRAPQISGGTDLQIDPIEGTIEGESSVVVEGYKVYTPPGGAITASLEGSSTSTAHDGTIYGDAKGFTANTSTILSRLLTGTPNASSSTLFQITPGAEIINPTGDLTLSNNWDLSTFRFGPNSVAGDLTLRAAGNLVFNGSLTDGFAYNSSDSENVAGSPYTWDVMSGPSWSYRLVAGAQFTSSNTSTANYGSVQSLAELGLANSSVDTDTFPEVGSLLLGKNIPAGINIGTLTSSTASQYAQLIRTGSGDITIDTGGSVDLLNQLATIYTAGSPAPALSGFDLPTGISPSIEQFFEEELFDAVIEPAQPYSAVYTRSGGNISIDAQLDIAHLTNPGGGLTPDTSWQFPTNWLYRRGATSSTDVFDVTQQASNEVASTTWWTDFSNFFEGIGALGGGNVTLNAGGNIVNVDAVVPTNARLAHTVTDSTSNLIELGGGDLSVIAGGTIEGGTYYVERGQGTIEANTITSADDTVRVSAYDLTNGYNTPLPLTLFVGDANFTVDATNSLEFGSAVNPFWLPQGIGNGFNDESIFNTYASNSSVSLASLVGSIQIQGSQTSGNVLPGSLDDAYLSNASFAVSGGYTSVQSISGTPWTLTLDPSLADSQPNYYATFYEIAPPVFAATAYSGGIQYVSDQTLAPSSQGTLRLQAATSVEGAFDSTEYGNGLTAFITILDDDPTLLPTVIDPFGLGASTLETGNFDPSIAVYVNEAVALTSENPSYALQSFPTLESYHTKGLLHNNDTTPVEIDTH